MVRSARARGVAWCGVLAWVIGFSYMRTVVVVLGVLVFGAADAAPRAIEGQVTATSARWTADGTRIVTTATIHTANGDVVVSQLGGTVDGLTMRVFHGPESLVPG